ncbi:YdcF family protein [uncultured Devosia sp.]|uniref:YdcF family protein n=1 Tax=uncultured Devosia sp. TaxID=211434 RepID=UPI0035CC9F86
MRLARRIYRALIALLVLVLVVGGGMAVDIWRFAGETAPGTADAALVLGAAVIGSTPTPVLRERLRHAADLLQTGQVQKIVVTGGLSPEDDLTEAEASRNWLVAQGIASADVLLEDASRTTIENLAFAKPVLAANAIDTVLVVSDPLHMRRAVMIAARLGIMAQPSPTPTSRYQSWQTTLPFLAREVWFMGQYLVTGT